MGSPSVQSLARANIGGMSLVQAIFDDSGTNEPFAYDVFPGPCRLFRIDLTWFQDDPEDPREGFLKLYDDKEPILGISIPDFIVAFRTPGVIEGGSIPVLIPGIPIQGMDFSVGCSFTVVSEGGTGGIEAPSNDVPISLILTGLDE